MKIRSSITLAALAFVTCASLASASFAQEGDAGHHLFILTGQSNMAKLNSPEFFNPIVEKEFGKYNVIVVRDAKGGQPISRWYKNWKPGTEGKEVAVNEDGTLARANGELYQRLFELVLPAIRGKKIRTVTFVWMQGEKDAVMGWSGVYAVSLKGLVAQVAKDFGAGPEESNVVIGRLSDNGFKLPGTKPEHWKRVREIQVEVAQAHPRGAWVNTDDLNDGMSAKGTEVKDDLHYTPEGFKILGERFANAAIDLIENRPEAKETFVLDQRLVEQIEAKLAAERKARALRKEMEKSGEIAKVRKKGVKGTTKTKEQNK